MPQQDRLWPCKVCHLPLGRVVGGDLHLGGAAIAAIRVNPWGLLEVTCRCGGLKRWLPWGAARAATVVS